MRTSKYDCDEPLTNRKRATGYWAIEPVPGSTFTLYRPLEKDHALFLRLAETAPTHAGISAFVHTYGSLTYRDDYERTPGEAEYVFTEAIGKLRLTREVWEASRTRRLRTACQRVTDAARQGADAGGFKGRAWVLEPLTKVRTAQDIRAALTHLFNNHYKRMVHRVGYEMRLTTALPGNCVVMEVAPETLLDAVWMQFAEAVAADAQYRRCDHCGNWMDARTVRADARFCGASCRQMAYLKRTTE